jgi:uncharacterized protein (TIGR02597 family)
LIAAAGLSATSLFAQSVTTVPVGAVTTTVKANSDERTGPVLQRASLFTSKASSVSAGTITVSGTVPSLGTETKYVKITSGTQAGQWFTLTGSTGTTLTVAENLVTLGVQANDTFEVRPFWTLSSLLPSGGGLPASTDFFDPSSFVFFNDPAAVGINLASSAAYFYFAGDVDNPAGWYSNGDQTNADNVVINPEVSMILRNVTAQNKSIVTIGEVPAVKFAISVASSAAAAQDNVIYNPYPAALTLSTSGLDSSTAVKPSTDFFDPLDQVFVYAVGSTGLNAATSKAYFYFIGDLDNPAGWYDSEGTAANSATIPAGAAFIIRKAKGSNSVVDWTPSLPYTL